MIGSICKKYTLYYLAGLATFLGINFLFGPFKSSVLSIILSVTIANITPAFWAGYIWFKDTGFVPESATSWKLASLFTGIQLTVSVVLITVFTILFPELMKSLLKLYILFLPGIIPLLIGGALFGAMISFLLTRIFFPIGAKQAAKAALAV